MPWIWAALMPHPPIIIPAVGKGREKEATVTIEGAKHLCALLTEQDMDAPANVLLVLSPHHAHAPGALFLNNAPEIHGSLARFGAPAASVSFETSLPALAELEALLKSAGIPFAESPMPDITPDHGAIVPLLGLAGCFSGPDRPRVLLGNPAGLSPDQAFALGAALRKIDSPHRWALLASGDLSHRLKQSGPYGYNPEGPVFDTAVVRALRDGDPGPLRALSQKTCDDAGECGMRPVLTLLGLAQGPVRVLSYEGPFGVGYCNAFWSPDRQKAGSHATPAPGQTGHGHPYTRLARMTIAAKLAGQPLPGPDEVTALSPDASRWNMRRACFVSIKNRDGSLRGCIGTFVPTRESLDAEIIANAISAATRDPRFLPMRADELEEARISVDILSQPEPLVGGMELDPARYGVIVTKGERRGLLLPDLEGVDSVEKQLGIAVDKAGITGLPHGQATPQNLKNNGIAVYRFTVERFQEGNDDGDQKNERRG